MTRKLLFVLALILAAASTAFGGFLNGGFESGDFTGWTLGAGW